MDSDCFIAGHKPRIEHEANGDNLSWVNRCTRCGEQLPMPKEWVADRMEWERNRPALITPNIGCP